jgi:hypothetical protein
LYIVTDWYFLDMYRFSGCFCSGDWVRSTLVSNWSLFSDLIDSSCVEGDREAVACDIGTELVLCGWATFLVLVFV